ncbi:MAG: hypothetical protein HC822_05125 [Oscillochloris sp.]|nr:hypothetical protein [Oscillochloris sp.]
MPLHRIILVLCLLTLFGVALFSPVRDNERSDPWGALLVSQALIEQRSIKLDSYPDAVRELGYRVLPLNGHQFYAYPFGTSLAAVPAVAAARMFGMDMALPADDYALQNLLAALSVAALFGLGYLVCRAFVQPWPALIIAAVTVLSTALMPTMGGALWSTNLAVLCVTAALAILVQPEQNRLCGALIGILLVGAYVARPSSLTFIGPALLFLLLARRRMALAALIATGVGFALFVGFSLITHGELLPLYYRGVGRLSAPDAGWVAIALYGLLFSPGRGLIVFSPQLIILIVGCLWLFKQLRYQSVFWLSIGWLGAHLALLGMFYHWWGGYSYGSRLFSDAMPALFPLTALLWRAAAAYTPQIRRAGAGVFLAFALVGGFFNTAQGLFNPQTLYWNVTGAGYYDVEALPEILFDWRFPPFLASLEQFQRRDAALLANPPRPNTLFGRRVWPVVYLRQSAYWNPPGITVDPQLAVLLDRGWHQYEEAWGGRWIRADATIWVESDVAGEVELVLKPYSLYQAADPAVPNILHVQIEDGPVQTQPLTVGHVSVFRFRINQGSTAVHLRYAGGEANINGDPRLLALALENTELTLITVADHDPQ